MNKKLIIASSVILTGAAFYFFQDAGTSNIIKEEPLQEIIIEEEEEVNLLYGINVNELDIIEGVVGKNQTLSTILAPFNVSYQIIDEIARKSKDVFDVRKIAFNKKFTVLSSKDTSLAQFFIYEPNPAEYVVFKLDEGEVYKEEKPVEWKKVEIGGTISSNLYVNMTELGLSPDLINQFADLYGWMVDFGSLQKGDKFKVVFSEKVVENQTIGIGDIEAAFFEHKGTPYHAIPFEQNGERSFFDQDGNSFKKAFLKYPVKYTRISSAYNLKRFHPVQKRYKAHLGTDYAAPTGTEIRTVGDGTVVEARYTSANGNFVKIKHNGTYTTQYLHMSKIASGMKPGARVSQGQVIGYVGSTGLATGPHLCFRFWKNGKQVDWQKEKIPPSEPISNENKLAFEHVKLEKERQIAAIPYSMSTTKLVAKNN
ncbi:Membrane proteins related to metalloendopeptidases [Aquiflexum balticum DSM 16537]|uniref:Membrane proteins related to metalloendopeptidases n=1 Tax=Aquiflexum balticum DSM 16537 TaxID=758820 RepID=A0A1W2GZL1_9BACT|nr:peptidoglycan DD-metalloendopeptidase family protein [Aquiflexum balticum]SMD42079.1 Membrane proteins related to metalloendopeptidases [Aquiflexum balticum DSM 16537]